MKCSLEICDRPHQAKGYCSMHYRRNMRNGAPLVKRRARGVMDAPVVRTRPLPPKPIPRELCLGPKQTKLLCLIWRAPVEVSTLAQELGVEPIVVMHKVHAIRRRFGYDAIQTTMPKGKRAHYQLNPEVLR